MPRPELEALQLRKVRVLLGWAKDRSPFWARKLAGIDPEQVRTLDDLRRVPFLTKDELLIYCKDQLTGYKRPKYVEFRDSLPKTNVGKILRRELRDEKQPA